MFAGFRRLPLLSRRFAVSLVCGVGALAGHWVVGATPASAGTGIPSCALSVTGQGVPFWNDIKDLRAIAAVSCTGPVSVIYVQATANSTAGPVELCERAPSCAADAEAYVYTGFPDYRRCYPISAQAGVSGGSPPTLTAAAVYCFP